MKRSCSIILFIVAIMLPSFISTTSVYAGTMDVTSFNTMSGNCTSDVLISHNFSISGTTVDITMPDRDVIALVLYDGHGDAFAYIGISVTVGFSGNATTGWNYPILVAPKSRPFTMKIFDNTTVVMTSDQNLAGAQHGTLLDVVNFDPVDYGVCQYLPVYAFSFNDGRINNWDMGAPVVVYGHDFADQRGLVIYTSTGVLLLVVYPDDLIACPEENTLILSHNGVSLYRLSSCEYQVTASSLDRTKTYNLIFKVFYPNTGYISYEE